MDPRSRVEAFIADFGAAHKLVAPAFVGISDRFEKWRQLLKELELTHGTTNFLDYLGGSFGNPPEFAPEQCQVVGVHHDDATALVQVSRPRGYEYVEFYLEARDGQWRINEILEFLDPPDSPLLDGKQYRQRLTELEGMPDFAPLGEQDRADLGALFQAGPATVALSWDETMQVELRIQDLGVFPISGRVAVGDWGYAEDCIVVLNRSLPARDVRAQAATVKGDKLCERVVGLRLVLSDEPIASWHRALMGDKGHYAVSVDAGMAGIFDAERYFSMSTRAWTRAVRDFGSERARLVTDGSAPIGAVTSSGWGDGAYGVYWGLDASGEPAQLVIDYAVLPH